MGGAYTAFRVCAPRTRATSLSPRPIRGRCLLLEGRRHEGQCRRYPLVVRQKEWRTPRNDRLEGFLSILLEVLLEESQQALGEVEPRCLTSESVLFSRLEVEIEERSRLD